MVRLERAPEPMGRSIGARQAHALMPVAVSDPIPSYRQGVAAALEQAGFDVVAVDAPEEWAAKGERGVLVLTVGGPDDTLLHELRAANRDLLIVALVRGTGVEPYRAVLRSGVAGAVAWDEPPEVVVGAVEAAIEGFCLLRLTVAAALSDPPPPSERQSLSPWEVKWLQRLADGNTVAELGDEVGYSEREMFRLLQRLYRRMGARTRIEAIVKAARMGLLS